MTKAQAAELLGVGEKTVTNYANDGLLETRYVPGKTRPVADYNEQEVRELKRRIDSGELGKGIKKVRNIENGNAQTTNTENGKPKTGNTEPANTEIGKSSAEIVLSRSGNTESPNAEIGKNVSNYFVVSPGDMEAMLGRVGQVTIQELAAKPLLTFPEAAQLTGLSERALRIGAKEGKLVARRQGRADRILRSDLDTYLREIQK